jgi:hypothetical protein
MALIGRLFAIAVQINWYMSSTVWIFALAPLILLHDTACRRIPITINYL